MHDTYLSDAWDPFLDAYMEVKGERDEAVCLLKEMLPNVHKNKRDKFEEKVSELNGTSSSDSESGS